MCPVLFEVFGVPIPAYGISFLAAIGITLLIARWRSRAFGVEPSKMTDFLFWGGIGALLCAKLLHLLVLWFQLGWGGFDLLSVLRGGGIFYGGVFGALTGFALFARWNGLSFWNLGDVIVPGGTIGHAVGRLGCFMAGCCYGRPTGSPIGVTFTDPLAGKLYGTPLGVRVHPVQLYESGAVAAIGVILLVLTRNRPFPGVFFPAYLLLYAPVRFVMEFFRDDYRGVWLSGALSTSQGLSLAAFAVGAFSLVWLRKAASAGRLKSP